MKTAGIVQPAAQPATQQAGQPAAQPAPQAAAQPVRSGLNNLFIFSQLREARSQLYRRQILQVNIRWKALDEIYRMYILLHLWNPKCTAQISKFQQRSRHNFGKFEQMKIQFIRIFAILTLQLLFCF